jgi:hypothetical protein
MVTGSDPGDHLHGGGQRCLMKQKARAREDGEEGLVGPTAHQELAGVVGFAGGGRTVVQSTMAELGGCRGNGDASDDSGHPVLIPSMGRKMAARWRSRAGRWSLGRRRTATESGAMAGKLGTCRWFRERESPSEKERRERAGGGGRLRGADG